MLMEIYLVKQGDTIYSIAEAYGISPETLIRNNGIINYDNLVIGQTIVIVFPEETYLVKEGDTLFDIAATHNVTPLELLRNNPALSSRRFLYPGEELVIRYNNANGRLKTNGYAYPFIDFTVLIKTLPYLSFLTIFAYQLSSTGLLSGYDDADIINNAKIYGVAPIMFLNTSDSAIAAEPSSFFSRSISYEVLDYLITLIIDKIEETGYSGVNLFLENITLDDYPIIVDNVKVLSSRMKEEGLITMFTLTPEIFNLPPGITYLDIDYTDLAQAVDYIILASYNWGFTFGPPAAVTPIETVTQNLDYATSVIPSREIFIGIPIIGYDWKLSSDGNYTVANALNSDAAIMLASDVGAIIEFDTASMAPFFTYTSRDNNTDVNHIVWFKDARSIQTLYGYTQEYMLAGAAVWNIMHFFEQMWFIINTQYQIIGPYDEF